MKHRTSCIVALLGLILVAGCDWKTGITASGTRDAVEELIGMWFSTDDGSRLNIMKWDGRTYAISTGTYAENIYAAHHSDIEGLPLISARNLDNGHWVFVQWRLVDDDHLEVRFVSKDVVPYAVTDPAEIVRILRANRDNPALLGPPSIYKRVPSPRS